MRNLRPTSSEGEIIQDALRKSWLWIVLAGLLIFAFWRAYAFGSADGGDGAHYLLHAEALLAGRPYGDTGYLAARGAWALGPALQPPGLPIALVPVLAVFGKFSVAPRVLMHFTLLAWLILAWKHARQTSALALTGLESGDARTVATGALLIMAASMLVQDVANVVGTDLGFAALVWSVILLLDGEANLTWRRVVAVAILGSAAIAFRLAAIALIPALGVFWLVRRREVGLRLLPVLALWASTFWLLFVRWGVGRSAPQVAATESSGSPMEPAGALGGLLGMLPDVSELGGRVVTNLVSYRQAGWEALLYPFPWSVANAVYHFIALVLAVWGLAPWLYRARGSFAVHFAFAYVTMLAIAPVVTGRYLWVLFPLIALGVVVGIIRALDRIARWSPTRAVGSAAAVVGALTALAIVTAAIQRPLRPDDRSAWQSVGERIRSTGNPNVVAASNRPRKMAWYNGIASAPLFASGPESQLEYLVELGVDYVIVDTTAYETWVLENWEATRRLRPGLFERTIEAPPLIGYRLRLPPSDDSRP